MSGSVRTLVANNTVRVDGARIGTIGVSLSSSTNAVLESNKIETDKTTEVNERSSLQ